MPLYDVTVTTRFIYTAVEADTEELAMELVKIYADDELRIIPERQDDLEFSVVERR